MGAAVSVEVAMSTPVRRLSSRIMCASSADPDVGLGQAPRDAASKRISKHFASVFEGTGLLEWLRGENVETITLTGYMTNNCVLASAASAEPFGLTVEVLSDATGPSRCRTTPVRVGSPGPRDADDPAQLQLGGRRHDGRLDRCGAGRNEPSEEQSCRVGHHGSLDRLMAIGDPSLLVAPWGAIELYGLTRRLRHRPWLSRRPTMYGWCSTTFMRSTTATSSRGSPSLLIAFRLT